jgi:Zn-dependent M28 family amino/carboxypeptidase
VFFAGAEEVGGPSGDAYLAAHRNERHAATMESDFGADRVWRVEFKLPESANAVADRIATALAPLGIGRGRDPANGGADIEPLVAAGTPVVDLNQDGTRYFDYHHTPDDTFDKIDPAQLAQNVAAWTVTVAILANAPETLGEGR